MHLSLRIPAASACGLNPIRNASGHSVLFEVQDSGIGIAGDKLGLIFEAFQQADGSTKRKYGGTGSGAFDQPGTELFIKRRSVCKQQGRGGKCFYIADSCQPANSTGTKPRVSSCRYNSVPGPTKGYT